MAISCVKRCDPNCVYILRVQFELTREMKFVINSTIKSYFFLKLYASLC